MGPMLARWSLLSGMTNNFLVSIHLLALARKGVSCEHVSSLFHGQTWGQNGPLHDGERLSFNTFVAVCQGLLPRLDHCHYHDVIMSAMASQITSLMIVYSAVYSGADQRKHQNSTSIAFVWDIHRLPVNSPHTGPVTQKVFSFNGVSKCTDGVTATSYLIG